MVSLRGTADAGGVKKILLAVGAVVAAFIVLKVVALVSALIGLLLSLGVLALLGFGVYSAMQFVTKGRRNRRLI